MANSMTYNGVDLGGSNYRFVVEENRFLDPPQPRVNREPLAMADGEAVQGASFGARVGVVRGVVHATSYANLLVQRDNIEAALSVGQMGAKVVSFDSLSGKQFRARVLQTAWSNETPCTIDLAITLLAPDPWAEASSATTDGGATAGGGTTDL